MRLPSLLILALVLRTLASEPVLAAPPATTPAPSSVPDSDKQGRDSSSAASHKSKPKSHRKHSPSAATPPPAATTPLVFEAGLVDELALQAWVNNFTAKGQRIVAVVSLGSARSLFVVEEAQAPRYIVIRCKDTLDVVNLSKMLELYKPYTLVGSTS